MNLTNPTPYPALNYEGIDQRGQAFHVIVMRQTYTWNEEGLLIPTDEQHPILMQDILVDSDDLMSGVLQESDLAHYKPKCDVLVTGHAYPPKNARGKAYFQANIHLQVPNSHVIETPKPPSKYPHIHSPLKGVNSTNTTKENRHPVQGQTLINKTINIYSRRQAINNNDSITGKPRYYLDNTTFDLNYSTSQSIDRQKVSLAPTTSFGGYCLIEENDPKLTELAKLNKKAVIPVDKRNIRINPNHKPIAYMAEDDYNPNGTGYLSPLYHQAMKPDALKLPQVMPLDITDTQLVNALNDMVSEPLDNRVHSQMTVSFGIRSASHPDRQAYYGVIDDEFIGSDALLPKGFDFAVWNSAYPDQQTTFLKGNEWLTLTNLCSSTTTASYQTGSGDTQLRLYLPESLVCLSVLSNNPQLGEVEMPMKLDTVVVSPDSETVNLVWRSMIVADFDPTEVKVSILERQDQDELIEEHFTRFAWVDRPYE